MYNVTSKSGGLEGNFLLTYFDMPAVAEIIL